MKYVSFVASGRSAVSIRPLHLGVALVFLLSQGLGWCAPTQSAPGGWGERVASRGGNSPIHGKWIQGIRHSNASSTAPSTLADWEAKALRDFPDLGVENSPFNRTFRDYVARLRQTNPGIFSNPSWPYLLAIHTAQSISEPSPAETVVPSAPHAKETTVALSELCATVVTAKIKSGEISGHREEWIAGGRIVRGKRSEALYISFQTVSGLVDQIAGFVAGFLENPNLNHPEDLEWLAAILVTPTEKQFKGEENPRLRAEVAAKLGLEEGELVSRLIPRLEEPALAKDLLREPPLYVSPNACPIPLDMRADLLLTACKASFTLGKTHLSKAFCLHELRLVLRHLPEAHPLTREAFEFLESMPLSEWPEELMQPMRAPSGPFVAESENWKWYVNWLTDRGTLAREKKYPMDGTYGARVHLLEIALIKRLMKASEVQKDLAPVLEAIASEVRASQAPSASNALRVIPALAIAAKRWPLAKNR